jgi:hypothetical protein
MFATVPNSRIYSWETWFIFNLRENKEISHATDILHLGISFSNESRTSRSFIYIYTYLSSYSLQHLANMSILASSSGWTEPFTCSHLSCIQFVWLGPPSNLLFVPMIHILHVQTSLNTRRLNTFIQVNIMDAQRSIYNEHIYSLQHLFSCLLLTSGQAGWPRTFMSGTDTTIQHS